MLRIGIALFALTLAFPSVFAANSIPLLPPPKLEASSYLLIDAQTSKVLAEHNAQEKMRQPA